MCVRCGFGSFLSCSEGQKLWGNSELLGIPEFFSTPIVSLLMNCGEIMSRACCVRRRSACNVSISSTCISTIFSSSIWNKIKFLLIAWLYIFFNYYVKKKTIMSKRHSNFHRSHPNKEARLSTALYVRNSAPFTILVGVPCRRKCIMIDMYFGLSVIFAWNYSLVMFGTSSFNQLPRI